MAVVLEGVALGFWLLLICVVGIAKRGPVGLVNFYEQDVMDRVVSMGLITADEIKKRGKFVAAALFIPVLTVFPAMVFFYNKPEFS